MNLRYNKHGQLVQERERQLNGSYTDRMISNVQDFAGPNLNSERDISLRVARVRDEEARHVMGALEAKKKVDLNNKRLALIQNAQRKKVTQEQLKGLGQMNGFGSQQRKVERAAIQHLQNSRKPNVSGLGNANWAQYRIESPENYTTPDIIHPHLDWQYIENSAPIGHPTGTDATGLTDSPVFPQSYGSKYPQMGSWPDGRKKIPLGDTWGSSRKIYGLGDNSDFTDDSGNDISDMYATEESDATDQEIADLESSDQTTSDPLSASTGSSVSANTSTSSSIWSQLESALAKGASSLTSKPSTPSASSGPVVQSVATASTLSSTTKYLLYGAIGIGGLLGVFLIARSMGSSKRSSPAPTPSAA